jgi:hypothetical protein
MPSSMGGYRPDMELAAGDCIHDLLFEHQVADITGWDHHALLVRPLALHTA